VFLWKKNRKMHGKQEVDRLREEAKQAFVQYKYHEAIAVYTQCIILSPDSVGNYTNRAQCYIRLFTMLSEELQDEKIMNDCRRAVELDPRNMKAYYLMGLCCFHANKFNEANSSFMEAYKFALEQNSSSTKHILEMLLKSKQGKFERKERMRMELEDDLYSYVIDKLRSTHEKELQDSRGENEDREKMIDFHQRVEERLFQVFRRSKPSHQAKEAPLGLIDPITFQVFRDPVMAPSGHTYEKGTILAHLRQNQTDPITRQALTANQLVPNRLVRELAERFLEENGDVSF
jgi:STIP1 family protein 1